MRWACVKQNVYFHAGDNCSSDLDLRRDSRRSFHIWTSSLIGCICQRDDQFFIMEKVKVLQVRR